MTFPRVEVYTRMMCSHCDRVKKILNTHSIPFIEHKIDVEITIEQVKEKFPSAKMLPVIVVDGNWVEHLADLRQLLLEG